MRARLTLAALLPFAVGCEEGGLNLFSIQDDMDLGAQIHQEILADPSTYPILDERDWPDAYEHLYRVRDEVLASGEVSHADEFAWEAFIIHDDDTLNAFAAPGGYIYVYTGLIKFLEFEDHFAGVMGHELAHAAERHSTEQLTQAYGLATLVALILGEDPGLLTEIAQSLLQLSFSRAHENDADEHSVYYLCNTDYAANGAAGFFEALEGWEIPEFLSTHPSSSDRVGQINALAESLACDLELTPDADYEAFVASLPGG